MINEIDATPERTNSLLVGIGSVGTEAGHSRRKLEVFGLRRIIAATALVGASLAAAAGFDLVREIRSNESVYRAGVEACASELVGYDVNLNVSPDDEGAHVMVPTDVFTEVNACQTAAGDVDRARQLIEDGNVVAIEADN